MKLIEFSKILKFHRTSIFKPLKTMPDTHKSEIPFPPVVHKLKWSWIRRRSLRYSFSWLLFLLFVLHTLHWIPFPFLDHLELLSYDARLRATMPGGVDPRVVIADVDEKSLVEEGHWPWPRDRIASLVERLFNDYHVGVVAFDVVFAEPDRSSGWESLQSLASQELKKDAAFQSILPSLKEGLDYDGRFAASLRGRRTVLGYYFDDQVHAVGQLPEPVLEPYADKLLSKVATTVHAEGYGANLPVLQKSAASAGHFTPSLDQDGLVRSVPLLIDYKGRTYEALSLAVVRAALDNGEGPTPIVLDITKSGLEAFQIGSIRVPVDSSALALVPYRGRRNSFPYISATDILHNRVDPALLDKTVVLVGSSAPGLMDLRATPVGEIYPGVEVHANLIAGIFDQTLKEQPSYLMTVDLFQTLFLGGIAVVLIPVFNPMIATLITLVLLAVAVAWNLAIWHWGNIVLPLVPLLLLIFLIQSSDILFGYFFESRTKKQLANLFGQYVPQELVEEMSLDPSRYSLVGTSRQMTVLFSDVRNFTNISEKLDPVSLSQLMNDYLTPMTRIIHQSWGTVDKYIGDAIMAFWGAPVEDPEHARRAILAALDMQERAAKLSQEFQARGGPEIRIGIGINTGNMRVGNMGSEFRMAYTVMGDAVNLASRLEGLTKQYGVTIIVGEQTRVSLLDFSFRELDRVKVKGKNEAVTIYEPLGRSENLNPSFKSELSIYRQALADYRAQNWDQASIEFYRLCELSPETKLYHLYLDRTEVLRNHPPGQNWDGSFVFTSK